MNLPQPKSSNLVTIQRREQDRHLEQDMRQASPWEWGYVGCLLTTMEPTC